MPGPELSWKDVEPVIQSLAKRFDYIEEPRHRPARQTSRDVLLGWRFAKRRIRQPWSTLKPWQKFFPKT
jgi:hypothetical protein